MKAMLTAAVLLAAGVAAADPVLLTGAGATFPYPLYSKWFSDYNRAHPDVRINYQSIGSGGGIKQVTEKTVDFGATDAPMTDAELKKAPGVVHLPTVLGAVVIAYQLPEAPSLQLSAETLAQIFLGKITQWNDPALVRDNPTLKLPARPLTVAHRADGSGTTAIFTDYLAKVSPEWKSRVGAGKSVKWPAGLGGKGNEGVTGLIKQAPGTVGYVELAYAHQSKLSVAALKNAAGNFVKPSLESISAAAAGVTMPADFRVSLTQGTGKDAYPLAAFTYLLVPSDWTDAAKGNAFIGFLLWAVKDGQKSAGALDYAPLPAPVAAQVETAIRALHVAGAPYHAPQ